MRSTKVIGTRLPRSAADALEQRAAQVNTSASAVIRAALAALKSPEVRAAVALLAPEIRSTLAPVLAETSATPVRVKPAEKRLELAAPRARRAVRVEPAPKRPAQLRPAQSAVTRETLCRHLGLSEKTSSYEIRRHAKNALSGSRSLGSSVERAAALTAHLGLARGSNEDQTLAIVWTLTAPLTAANPYLKRLAGK